MANNNPETAVSNGLAETTSDSSNSAANGTVPRRSQSESQKASPATPVSAAPPLRKQLSNSRLPVSSPSPQASPRTSRNASPTRKPQPLAPVPMQPSAAAIQRALSATQRPQLQSQAASDSVLPKAPKSAGASGDNTPHWPTSPRLKSPPPSGANSRRGSSTNVQRKVDTTTAPSISVQSATPQSATPPPAKQGGDETSKPATLQTPAKGPSRGPSGKSTLETVQENSADDTKEPSPAALKAAADLKLLTKLPEGEITQENGSTEGEKQAQQVESGNESAGTKQKRKEQQEQASRPKNAPTKSYASLTSTKSRQGEGKQNMTVETETVPSIPQSQLSAGDRSGNTRSDNSGSIRLKPSSETIRPKKERKKPTSKARSINQSTTSSKADIFEQRVADAVEQQANSSDSEETFVYESNPPEPQRRRHHSRTPSVTSAHSTADQQRGGIRNLGEALDERRIAGKRSMKFSNNPYTDTDSPDGKDGSVRSHTPRHFGRFGRGGSQASMFDQDSPFTQASKLRSNAKNSRPNSPRSPHNLSQQHRPSGLFSRSKEPSYDFDAEGGDDERTPLVGTVRTPRSGRLATRRINSSSHSIDEYYGVRRHSRCGRIAGLFLGLVVLFAVILSAVAFLVMSNRPLYEVKVLRIENVLASEQELMLDLWVEAVNPNALGITITDMDINIFARSSHVGSGEFWRHHGYIARETRDEHRRKRRRRVQQTHSSTKDHWRDLSDHWHAPLRPFGGVDHGTDPDDDLERDAQTMLLGRIFHFDQELDFEGSPIKRHPHNSTGELRLEKPGNKTETGGSERWEKVLQHPFELIIRGVLRYNLPISNHLEKVAVGASYFFDPEDQEEEIGSAT